MLLVSAGLAGVFIPKLKGVLFVTGLLDSTSFAGVFPPKVKELLAPLELVLPPKLKSVLAGEKMLDVFCCDADAPKPPLKLCDWGRAAKGLDAAAGCVAPKVKDEA